MLWPKVFFIHRQHEGRSRSIIAEIGGSCTHAGNVCFPGLAWLPQPQRRRQLGFELRKKVKPRDWGVALPPPQQGLSVGNGHVAFSPIFTSQLYPPLPPTLRRSTKPLQGDHVQRSTSILSQSSLLWLHAAVQHGHRKSRTSIALTPSNQNMPTTGSDRYSRGKRALLLPYSDGTLLVFFPSSGS